MSGAAVLLCWLLPAAAVSAAPQAGAGGSSRPSLGALAGSLAALDSCLRGADRHQIAASRSAGRARRFAGVELQRWHLRLRATEEIDFGWLDGCRRAGLVLGPPVELTSSGKGQTLQAVAWTVRVVAGGEPARPEAARQLETNLAWLRRLAKDSRPLLAMFAALATTDTVRLERARLSRRRLQLWGLVPNAAARTVLAEKLAGLARHLSWPLAVEVEGMRAGGGNGDCSGEGLVAAGVPAWLVLSAVAWLTGRDAVIAVAGRRLAYWRTRVPAAEWFPLLARQVGFTLAEKNGIWRAGPRLRPVLLPVEIPPATVDLRFTGAPAATVLGVIGEVAGTRLAVPAGAMPRLTAYVSNRLASWAAEACLAVLVSAGEDATVKPAAVPDIVSWGRPLAASRLALGRLRLLATFASGKIRAALFADGEGRVYLVQRGAFLGRHGGRLAGVGRGQVCLKLGRPGPLDAGRLSMTIEQDGDAGEGSRR